MECIHCHKYESNKESGLCDHCEKEESNKINGLLYLPALGIIGNIILTPISLYFCLSVLLQVLSEAHGYANFLTNFYSVGSFIVLTYMLLTYFTAWTFFKKKRFIQKVIIPYYILGAVNALYFTIFISYLFDAKPDTSEIRTLISAAFGVCLWIPYFLFSKRIPIVFHK